ncbi:hypothetical protein Tco_0557237 [Tanacetum coccineum]
MVRRNVTPHNQFLSIYLRDASKDDGDELWVKIAMEVKLNDVIVDVLKLVDGDSGIDAYDVWNALGLIGYVHHANMKDWSI